MVYDIILGRNEKDRVKYGKKGAVLLGRHYVKMGQVTSLSNNIYMDVTNSHIVFVCGKRGGGKCLDGDTLITLNDGSTIPIKDLEYDDHDILSLNKELKINKAQKSGFFKRNVNELLHIKLRSGKEIKLTPEHPLLTINGWIPAEELNAGSRIATPRIISAFGEDSLEEHKIKLLAYLIAEGHLGNRFVLFTNKDKIIIDDFNRAVNDFDSNLTIKQHSNEFCFRISANNKRSTEKAIRNEKGQFEKGSKFHHKSSLRLWLDKTGIYGLKSKEKIIPKIMFKSSKSNMKLFLNRLFSCDGSLYFEKDSRSWRISYCSSSRELIHQVQHLLLRFEVLSKIRTKTMKLNKKSFSTYEIKIKGEKVYKFIQEIGFFGEKEERQNKALRETESSKRNPNIDTVPKELWDSYRPESWVKVGKGLGYSSPKAARSSINYAPSRQKLLQMAITDNNTFIKNLAASDIFWDEIVYMEKLQGNFTVYDISVPENHNFVANDIIVHNSYTMGVIAEGMTDLPKEISNNLSIILLDTMGIYWTMKYPNMKDKELLNEWGLKPKGLNIQIYTPTGYYKKYKEQGIPTDFPFSIKPSELNPEDWWLTFELKSTDPLGVFIERIILDLKKKKKNFSMDDILDVIRKDTKVEKAVKDAAENRFEATKDWGVFSEKGTEISELAAPGQVTVLDVSCYATAPGGWKVKALVIGIVAQKLFIQRMVARKKEEYGAVSTATEYFAEEKEEKQEMPLVWMAIDEAHEFAPLKGKTAATDAIVTILREGRQPGVSLILATQQPGKIHTDVMTQSDVILSHRITAKLDTEALGMLMQSYMREGLDKQLDNLPRVKGSAIAIDDMNERMYAMRVRPRFTWHGGQAPTAMKDKKKVEL
ncbi:hypothetical protein CMO89_01130 [Candidatus Woesearchaeota archaeon]|nr:hypothetical protein [Candidatus Woesearchaeota archaeon]|tara:strand:+ start:3244 stop:5865 length:2622 start_codon:yes stop_codon:yes gene_type:complete